jgi:hypothetical protein
MVKITDYRGFEIFFDEHEEHFYANSERYDNESTKKSYGAVKTYIDDYIKNNQTFTPFLVQNKNGEVRRIVGIRKDLRFNYDDGKGGLKQFSDYEQSYFFKYDENNDPILKEAKALREQADNLNRKANNIEDSLEKNNIDWNAIKEMYRTT